MDTRKAQGIKEHLESKEVRERIRQRIHYARSEAVVTISRAARLFNFSENQLRSWEELGLLSPFRPKKTASSREDGREGHRQYPLSELDKLAVIRDLIDANYAPTDILTEMETIWETIERIEQNDREIADKPTSYEYYQRQYEKTVRRAKELHIDRRAESVSEQWLWRYFVAQVLRLALLFIAEDIPDTIAALVLPLEERDKDAVQAVKTPADLSRLGECLIGWQSSNRSFAAFLDSHPSFDVSSDFRVEPLVPVEEKAEGERPPQSNALVVIQRRALPLTRTPFILQTIQYLLSFLLEHRREWRASFDRDMRDFVHGTLNFEGSQGHSYNSLSGLANLIVSLGGKTVDGENRWHFCSVLLPKETDLPMQQHKLVVRGQSGPDSYEVDRIEFPPKNPGLAIRAYQSGQIIYRPTKAGEDFLASQEGEDTTQSAIAIPISGEDGLSIATLYVASRYADAFPEEMQRILRVVGRMLEEDLLAFRSHQKRTGKFKDLITLPALVDMSFQGFLTENDFVHDVEELLSRLLEEPKQPDREQREEAQQEDRVNQVIENENKERVVSFLAIDIDNHGGLATRYGEQVARNLSRAVGLQIKENLQLSAHPEYQRIYHMNADRFYLMLDGISLDEVREKAERLRTKLAMTYKIDARRVTMGRPMLPQGMLDIPGITVRLGVPSYPYTKLEELLRRYPDEEAAAKVRMIIMRALNIVLDQGQLVGGDCIISWDPKARNYILLPKPYTVLSGSLP